MAPRPSRRQPLTLYFIWLMKLAASNDESFDGFDASRLFLLWTKAAHRCIPMALPIILRTQTEPCRYWRFSMATDDGTWTNGAAFFTYDIQHLRKTPSAEAITSTCNVWLVSHFSSLVGHRNQIIFELLHPTLIKVLLQTFEWAFQAIVFQGHELHPKETNGGHVSNGCFRCSFLHCLVCVLLSSSAKPMVEKVWSFGPILHPRSAASQTLVYSLLCFAGEMSKWQPAACGIPPSALRAPFHDCDRAERLPVRAAERMA